MFLMSLKGHSIGLLHLDLDGRFKPHPIIAFLWVMCLTKKIFISMCLIKSAFIQYNYNWERK